MLSFLVALLALIFTHNEPAISAIEISEKIEQHIPVIEVTIPTFTPTPSLKPDTTKVDAYNESSDRSIGEVASVAIERALPLVPAITDSPTPSPIPTSIPPVLPSPVPTFQTPPDPCDPYVPELIGPPIEIPPPPCPLLTI